MLIEYREHDNCLYRVWTQEDAAYGAFQILTLTELKALIRVGTKMHWIVRPAKDADCTPVQIKQNERLEFVRTD